MHIGLYELFFFTNSGAGKFGLQRTDGLGSSIWCSKNEISSKVNDSLTQEAHYVAVFSLIMSISFE